MRPISSSRLPRRHACAARYAAPPVPASRGAVGPRRQAVPSQGPRVFEALRDVPALGVRAGDVLQVHDGAHPVWLSRELRPDAGQLEALRFGGALRDVTHAPA